ncbi:hypothetical protein [Rahnella bonaserana]|uniref:Uncharacterized protein n=1 Tax=Rahnella bonaserana TaxID=2816248 RepID=A0ABS6LQ21_9GAMM|nr:hypothetical protein [Rahnella bonaserana]MBU9854119.1 hypothetical protein [Rahnella bonaserana]
MLNSQQYTKLNRMLIKRKMMKVIAPKCVDQELANPLYVYEVIRLESGNYKLVNITNPQRTLVPNGGGWVFAVMDDAPGAVICGKADYQNVHGHTSLTGYSETTRRGEVIERERGVYFAGELVFNAGRLTRWTNGSGHFAPSRSLAFSNLLAPVRLTLPIHLFRPDDV